MNGKFNGFGGSARTGNECLFGDDAIRRTYKGSHTVEELAVGSSVDIHGGKHAKTYNWKKPVPPRQLKTKE